MKYLSLFSGIEAATMAWHDLGFEPKGFSEINPFCNELLSQKYPTVPNLGSVTEITEDQVKELGPIDLIVFGSPCQNLSVAGNRKGLAGEESSLFYAAIRIIQWARQHNGLRYALWENVPGAFSSNAGRDFASVVEQMAGLSDVGVPPKGWGTEGVALGEKSLCEWSVIDAQFFGVPQRRRRVFAIADFGNWRDRPPILLESPSLRGNTAKSKEKAQDVTATLTRGFGDRGVDAQQIIDGNHVIAKCLTARGAGGQNQCYKTANFIPCYGIQANIIDRQDHNGGNGLGVKEEVAPTLTKADRHAVAYGVQDDTTPKVNEERVGALRANAGGKGACVAENGMAVRKLTPVECERLQGFPDDFTNIIYKGRPAPDSQRYQALGNSMAVPVMRWIGKRLKRTELFESVGNDGVFG